MTSPLVENLSSWSGLSSPDVEFVIRSAPRRYKVFLLKKKRGGFRTVAQPSRELKVLQRLLVDRVLAGLPVHEAVHGYVRGRGIKSNALVHLEGSYFLKMDLENFFPSIRPLDLARCISRRMDQRFSLVERRQLYSLLFWRPKSQGLQLCIGAPSSPFISNALMYDLDCVISRLAAEREIVYTRYADDMTFSCATKGVLSDWRLVVQNLIESCRSPRLRVNHAKTVHISRAQRISITGVTVSAEREMSLGRERKRLIRAMVHRFRHGELDTEQCWQLRGLIAFAQDIEPEFAEKMREQCVPAGRG